MVSQWDSFGYPISASSHIQTIDTSDSIEYDVDQTLTLEQLMDQYNDDNSINSTSVVDDANADQFETSSNTDTVTTSAYHEDMTLPFLSDLEDINGDRVHWIKTAEIDIHTLTWY